MNDLNALLLLAAKPLDEITPDEAGAVVADVLDRGEEPPVGVARFSSAI